MQGLSVSLHAQLHLLSLPFLALDYVQRNANEVKKKKTNRHSCCQLPHPFCIGILWDLVHCHQTLGKNMCTLSIHASKNVTICCLISLEIFTQWKIHHKAVIIVSILFFPTMSSKTVFSVPASKTHPERWQEFTQIAWDAPTMCFEKPILPLMI